MSKVYISKSNFSNPDLLIKVNNLLKDCEIIQYAGGVYTQVPIKQCDALILVPTDCLTSEPLRIAFTGKGSGSEVVFAKNNNIPTYVALETDGHPLRLSEIDEIIVHDTSDWKKRYYLITADQKERYHPIKKSDSSNEEVILLS